MFLRPSGATGCSHGWSDAALSVAEPVEDMPETRAAPAGAEDARLFAVVRFPTFFYVIF